MSRGALGPGRSSCEIARNEVCYQLHPLFRRPNSHDDATIPLRATGPEGLTLGKPEIKRIIADTRKNVKLWNRVDEQNKAKDQERESLEQYRDVLSMEKAFLFDGLAAILEGADEGLCSTCSYRETYGAPQAHTFGGVVICAGCK